MKKTLWMMVTFVAFLPTVVAGQEVTAPEMPHIMSPRELLFEPETKDQLMALTVRERIESIGYVLELTNKEKQLSNRKIGQRAAKVEKCVASVIDNPNYKRKDAMAVISDCIVVLGYD